MTTPHDQHVASFNYVSENPTRWQSELYRLKEEGFSTVRLPVVWSAHESVRGMRDFSRGSRLKLEKVLCAAEEAGLQVVVDCGFRHFLQNTPLWARSEWEIPAYIPSTRVFERAAPMELTSVASLMDPEFQRTWMGFLDELFGIVGLYVTPGGPVTRVELDLSFFDLDQGAIHVPEFSQALGERYQSVDQINLRYRTTFRSLESVATPQGLRVLIDKRPWHALQEYKQCRQRLVQEAARGIADLESAETLRSQLHIRTRAGEGMDPAATVYVDSAMVESWGGKGAQCFPCTPDGMLHPQAALAYRVWETLRSQAGRDGYGVERIPFWEDKGSWFLGSELKVFVCGRFLEKLWVEELENQVSQGGQVLFPFGLPQFDERLAPLHWRFSESTNLLMENRHITRKRLGKGFVWLPVKAPDIGTLWPSLREWIQSIGLR